MALWTMTPDGQRVLVVPAHGAYAAAMTEGRASHSGGLGAPEGCPPGEGPQHGLRRPLWPWGRPPFAATNPIGDALERRA